MKRRLSISLKLIGFTAIKVAAIVGVMSWYFASRHVDALAQQQREHLANYGDMLSKEARSAVAFSDRETAREVLSALEAEDLAATTLYGAGGEVLYQTGHPSPWVEKVKDGVTAKRMIALGSRVAMVSPVVSLEGPRGALVIELSNERLVAEQRAVQLTAFIVGAIALAFGVLVSWWIARSLAKRLGAIGRVATAVRVDALTDERVTVDSEDEIGVLGSAFNAMLGQLRGDRAKLEATVSDLRVAEEALAKTNRELESRVEQRTKELRVVNESLRDEMHRRTEMELELRQAQKLESVGRLAAGVAHEINTPVQFVNDSIHFLRDATTDLMHVVEKLELVQQAVLAGTPAIEAAQDARDEQERADVEYLRDRIPKAFERSVEGLGRVATIVRSMKEFAHPDSKEVCAIDLNAAIASTLVISRNEYKYVADVTTSLGELPPVHCFAGEINQAILNIIVNAAHAIGDVVAGTENRGTITVTTRRDDNTAVIEISDTGTGIPESVRERIFDPFFTTKDVGKGTGQGLAITRSVIVDKHHGSIDVETQEGRGTTFRLRIPIDGSEARRAA